MIYLDNAATSFPKPETVHQAVLDAMKERGGNPGRSGHAMSIQAGQVVYKSRKLLADFFEVKNPMNVVFTSNATDALNLAILGTAQQGDHFITSSLEHNSTIRPLNFLQKNKVIDLTILSSSNNGLIDPEELRKKIRKDTKAVVINHASNVTGMIQPLLEISRLCREKETLLIADCAQSAGIIPINLKNTPVDILCAAGHKSMLGPRGTGFMILRDGFPIKDLRPSTFGGTGSLSDKIEQPDFLPDKYESGTLNVPGIAGLAAGVEYLNNFAGGMKAISEFKKKLRQKFCRQIMELDGCTNFSDPDKDNTGIISFNIEGFSASRITQVLSDKYGIMTRQGLHCAPLAHQTIGTFPEGTVRISFGLFTQASELDITLSALREIIEDKN